MSASATASRDRVPYRRGTRDAVALTASGTRWDAVGRSGEVGHNGTVSKEKRHPRRELRMTETTTSPHWPG